MKKILKSLVISMIMVFSMSASIFANHGDDIAKELLAVGVPSSYVGSLVEYLHKTTISDDDYNKVIDYIHEVQDIVVDVKDISEISDSDKLAIKNLSTKAGNILGLEITFGRSNGLTTLVITDTNGGTILKMDTMHAMEAITNIHPSNHAELAKRMVVYLKNTGNESTGSENVGNGNTGNEITGSENIGNGNAGNESTGSENVGNENTGTGVFEPVGGELTQTSTPYGNMMLVGLAMIISGMGIALVAKKQFA